MIPKKTVRNPLTSNGRTKYLYNIIITTLILYLATEINCCVVTPREFLTTVGEVVSLGCNARPNNAQEGTVSQLKLEKEDKSDTLIFQTAVYNANGKISVNQSIVDGYFLSELDENLFNAIVQINETQLKHGGRYVCICAGAASTGSGNLVVLDKLSFVVNGGNPQTPEALLDLECSFSFSGSISSVSVDLTINHANGTQLSAKRNLSLSSKSQGSHHVNYSFTLIPHDGKKEQNFTCEMNAWNQSSSEPLRSMKAYYCLNPDSWSDVTPTIASEGGIAAGVVVGVVLLVLLLIVAFVFVIIRRRRSQNNCTIIQQVGYEGERLPTERPAGSCKGNSRNAVAQNKPTTIQKRDRYEGGRPSIEHPTGSCSTEDKKPKNKADAINEVLLVDNDFYETSPGYTAPTADADGYKAEQIYNEIC